MSCRDIRAPALPSVRSFMSLASTDGKAGARIKTLHHHGYQAMSTVRVLKLGGSLLLLSDWPQRLRCWLSAHPAPLNFLLVGGGEIIESVRHLDAQHHFPASFSHWLCIDLLSATARIAGQLLPEFPLIATPAELQQIVRQRRCAESPTGSTSCTNADPKNNSNYLVGVSSFYQNPSAQLAVVSPTQPARILPAKAISQIASPLDSMAVENFTENCPLPENWDTTTDSLAAWLARVVGAQELVLFKSMTPSLKYTTPRDWAEQGIVDAAFADALLGSVSVQIVNLLFENVMS